jgi:hypothetical protein
MIIKLIEIYELPRRQIEEQKLFSLREVFINTEHVTCLREDDGMKKKVKSGQLPEELDSRQQFTKIHLNRGLSGIDLVVVGSPETIQSKLLGKTLLKG